MSELTREQKPTYDELEHVLIVRDKENAALRAKLVASEAAAYDVDNTIQHLKAKLELKDKIIAGCNADEQELEEEMTARFGMVFEDQDGVLQPVNVITAHIDALRAKLAQVEQYLESQRQSTYQAVAREHTAKQRVAELEQELERTKSSIASEYEMDMNDQLRKNRDLKQQLAAAQAERDKAVCNMKGYQDLVDYAKQQLANRDAEIARLKHQLSQLIFFTPGGGQ